MSDSLELKWERYLKGLKHGWACGVLGEDPGEEYHGEMEELWGSLSGDEQDEFDRRWGEVRKVLDVPPPAPENLGLVDGVAGDGILPRRVVGGE